MFGLRRSIGEWYWKFGPEGKASRIIVAADGSGRIVAQYAAVFADMNINGKVLRLSQALDAFCRPEPLLLKERIFLKTAQRFYQEYCDGPGDIRFYYGITGGKLLRLGELALNYRGLIPLRYLSKETPRVIRPLGKVFGRYVWSRWADNSGIVLRDIAALWERTKGRYRVSLVKDSGYFTRRFITHPHRKYRFLTAYYSGVLRGLAVLLHENNLVKIVDLLWDGESEDTIKYLTKTAWGLTVKTGAVKLEMWLNSDESARECLISGGMSAGEDPYKLSIIAVSSDPDIDAGYMADNLYFTMGDSDMF